MRRRLFPVADVGAKDFSPLRVLGEVLNFGGGSFDETTG